jgi:glycosyltransferase involved in cell wall biosynthesis
MSRTAVIVELGRSASMGGVRRAASWNTMLLGAGFEVERVKLTELPSPSPFDLLSALPSIACWDSVPESIIWPRRPVVERLRDLDPDLVVFVTLRCWDPHLATGRWGNVVDLVDPLSTNYRVRTAVASGHRRVLMSMLAGAHRRAETRLARDHDLTVVTAGYNDAASLGVAWVPIMATAPSRWVASDPDHDLGFVGNLAYEPNRDALHLLSDRWPALVRRRPSLRLLVAGANPDDEMFAMAEQHGWTMLGRFDDPADVYCRMRIAVSPLRIATGIQIKVLDAASHGVAQIASSAALAGFAPGFPARRADTDEEFADAVDELLDRVEVAADLAAGALNELTERYQPAAWAPWVQTSLVPHVPIAG